MNKTTLNFDDAQDGNGWMTTAEMREIVEGYPESRGL